VSCYEAGRDGFWLHRFLVSQDIESLVVDSSSIEVPRRKRRVKTDRVDVGKLYKLLLRHQGGEPDVLSVVRVPSDRDEDDRRVHRELQRLQKERTQHSNRIRSLLVTHGIVTTVDRRFLEVLEAARRWDGTEVRERLKEELLREYSRWVLVDDQIRKLRQQQRQALKSASTGQMKTVEDASRQRKLQDVQTLVQLCGIADRSAWPLAHEFFWRDFANRREVGGAAGLTGTPWNSGGDEREQGISKSGNKRVRHLMVELSWCWLRHQPDSAITQWFNKRFAHGSKRMRKIGIVAVARRLLIALWRYLRQGVVPAGARLKTLPAKA
jgi:transposase